MKKILLAIGISLSLLTPVGITFLNNNYASASAKSQTNSVESQTNTNSVKSQINAGVDATGQNDKRNAGDIAKVVINVMLFLVGILAVIMIIYSGIIYVTSSGNAPAISKAKTTLTYSIVGLVVAIFAYAIVNFVITNF